MQEPRCLIGGGMMPASEQSSGRFAFAKISNRFEWEVVICWQEVVICMKPSRQKVEQCEGKVEQTIFVVAFRQAQSSQISSKDVRKWQSGKIEISWGTKRQQKSLTKSGNLSATYLFGDAVSSFFVATTLSIIWRQKEIPLRHFWWWQWNVFSSNNANFLSPYFSPSSTKRWSWKGIKIRRVENQYPIIYYYQGGS